jgi:hypothetical protein
MHAFKMEGRFAYQLVKRGWKDASKIKENLDNFCKKKLQKHSSKTRISLGKCLNTHISEMVT